MLSCWLGERAGAGEGDQILSEREKESSFPLLWSFDFDTIGILTLVAPDKFAKCVSIKHDLLHGNYPPRTASFQHRVDPGCHQLSFLSNDGVGECKSISPSPNNHSQKACNLWGRRSFDTINKQQMTITGRAMSPGGGVAERLFEVWHHPSHRLQLA